MRRGPRERELDGRAVVAEELLWQHFRQRKLGVAFRSSCAAICRTRSGGFTTRSERLRPLQSRAAPIERDVALWQSVSTSARAAARRMRRLRHLAPHRDAGRARPREAAKPKSTKHHDPRGERAARVESDAELDQKPSVCRRSLALAARSRHRRASKRRGCLYFTPSRYSSGAVPTALWNVR